MYLSYGLFQNSRPGTFQVCKTKFKNKKLLLLLNFYRTLTTAYYRGAMGILLMYDVTSLESFNNLSYWLRNIQENAAPDVVKVLAGNKCECLPAQRMVEKERGDKVYMEMKKVLFGF